MAPIPFDTFGDPANPSVHFAHANGFPPATYRQFLEQLATRYHVVASHARPLWDSQVPQPSDNSWLQLADDMLRFFDEQGMQNIIGIGHSLGAVTTFYAALNRPNLFSKLILIEPVFLPAELLALSAARKEGEPAFNPMFKAAFNRRNQWDSRQAAWDRFRGKKNFARMSDEVLWDYVDGITEATESGFKLRYPRRWEAHFYAMPPLDIWELLPRIEQPTLGIRASISDTVFPQAWERWQQLQPDATFVELANLGHLLLLEDPPLVAQTVLAWLDEGGVSADAG